MIIGLQITKNKDKYNKLVSLINDNRKFKGVSFVHISDYKSLKTNFKDLDVLVCYGITPELFSYRSDKLKWIHIGASGIDDSLFNDIADFRPSSYPPYNIEKVGDCEYKLTFAVAGFSEKDISVTQKESTLAIEGVNSPSEKEYLYKGIAERTFKQSFKLSEYMNVKDAKLKDGMLNILLVQDLPKEKQPRQIKIN